MNRLIALFYKNVILICCSCYLHLQAHYGFSLNGGYEAQHSRETDHLVVSTSGSTATSVVGPNSAVDVDVWSNSHHDPYHQHNQHQQQQQQQQLHHQHHQQQYHQHGYGQVGQEFYPPR